MTPPFCLTDACDGKPYAHPVLVSLGNHLLGILAALSRNAERGRIGYHELLQIFVACDGELRVLPSVIAPPFKRGMIAGIFLDEDIERFVLPLEPAPLKAEYHLGNIFGKKRLTIGLTGEGNGLDCFLTFDDYAVFIFEIVKVVLCRFIFHPCVEIDEVYVLESRRGTCEDIEYDVGITSSREREREMNMVGVWILR